MRKVFIFFVLIFSLLFIFKTNNAFSSGWQYHWIKNTAWEVYGKLNSSYNYGKHRFEFDSANKIIHYIDGKYKDVYAWESDYKGNIKAGKEPLYLRSNECNFEIIDRYSIKIDGLTLRRVYH